MKSATNKKKPECKLTTLAVTPAFSKLVRQLAQLSGLPIHTYCEQQPTRLLKRELTAALEAKLAIAKSEG